MSFQESFLSFLPGEPEQAIIQLAERAIIWSNDSATPTNITEGVYICHIIHSFIKKTNLNIKIPEIAIDLEVIDYIRLIVEYSAEMEISNLLDVYISDNNFNKFGIAILSAEDKKKIRSKLEAIKKIIDASLIADNKKNALFDRINALAVEVDKNSTKTDRFFAFMGDAAFVVGELADKAKPFVGEIKDIMKILMRSRAENEGVALPPTDNWAQLPDPDEPEEK